jgi:hypothetical protein
MSLSVTMHGRQSMCFDWPERRRASERSSRCVIARDRLRSTAARSRPTHAPASRRHAAAATQRRAARPYAVRVTAVAPVSIWISDAATRSPRTPRVHGPELPVACASSPARHRARPLRSVDGDRERCAARARLQRPHRTNTHHRTRCAAHHHQPTVMFRNTPPATVPERNNRGSPALRRMRHDHAPNRPLRLAW